MSAVVSMFPGFCQVLSIPEADWDSPQWIIRSSYILDKTQFNLHWADHGRLKNTVEKG